MRIPNSPTQTRAFAFSGGENITAAALSIKPGELLFSSNYECVSPQGYRRIDGFERFDGRPKPSEASYWKLGFDAGTGAIAVGNIVTGATSGASGEALVVTVLTGTWAGGNAAGYLILFNVSGTFQDNENLQVSAATKAVANGPAYERGADNDTDDTTWLRAAIVATRADIGAITGSGRILGIWAYNGVTYAFRNNAGGTAAVMWKSSTSGWTQVDLGYEAAFTSGGTTEIIEGNTITGATSGKTAVVRRVITTSGTWAGGDAAGRFILSTPSGAFTNGENLNVGAGLNLATITANPVAITLAASGRYEFVTTNFYGSTASIRMYGCDGKNKAFEFDGTVYTPIATGMSTDTPTHIYAHKKHLFLSFAGGSVQHSSTGVPITFSAITGAAEIAIGEEVVGFVGVPDALAIMGRNKTSILYGSSSADWQLSTHSETAGAIEWTIQSIGKPIYLDDPGLTDLQAVQAFGNFSDNAFSEKIQSLLEQKKSIASASVTIRQKSQYRIFFTDDTGIICTFDKGKVVGFTRLDYGMVVRCACSCEDSSGNEVVFFGSDDGYVYQMDSGTSFDGTAITAFIHLPFFHYGSPRQKKRFRKIVMDVDAPSEATLSFLTDFDYGGDNMPQGEELSLDVQSGGAYWGENSGWGEFIWGAQVIGVAQGYIDGTGVNMSIAVRSIATYESPHTLQGAVVHYSPRGMER